MKRPYSDADLMAYSAEHVWYEVWMFFEVVNVLSAQPPGASSHSFSTSSGPSVSPAPLMGLPNSVAPLPGGSSIGSTVTTNMQIECFMGHLRNLLDFLFVAPRPTDVGAVDYCAAGSWAPTMSAALNTARTRVNKELAHLTTDRISGSPARKKWDVNALAAELRPVLRDFAAKADPAKLSPRVKSAIR
jgi:hypothetical protein